MADYEIEVTEEAKADLEYYAAFARKMIASRIRAQLRREPQRETKNRKPLRSHPVASWELRLGRYRVFYEVDESARMATVVAVGHKDRNVLRIRGKEVAI